MAIYWPGLRIQVPCSILWTILKFVQDSIVLETNYEEELPVQIIGVGSMFCSHLIYEKVESVWDLVHENIEAAKTFYPHIIEAGAFISNIHMSFISAAHRKDDVDRVIADHFEAVRELRLF